MGQVAQVILEGGETGDDLPVDPESRELVRNPFFGLRDDFEDPLTQSLQTRSFRLIETCQVLIDLITGHQPILITPRRTVKG